MSKKTPAQLVDDLLTTVPPPKSGTILARKPELVAAIRRFLELKAAGDERAHVSLSWFYKHKLRETFGGPCWESVRQYVQEVLRLNTTTGKVIK